MIYYFKDFGFGSLPICLEALSEYCDEPCDLCPVGVSNFNLLSMI